MTNDWNAWVPKVRGQPERTIEPPLSFSLTTCVQLRKHGVLLFHDILYCSARCIILKALMFHVIFFVSDGLHCRCFQDVTLFFRAIKSELVEFMSSNPVSLPFPSFSYAWFHCVLPSNCCLFYIQPCYPHFQKKTPLPPLPHPTLPAAPKVFFTKSCGLGIVSNSTGALHHPTAHLLQPNCRRPFARHLERISRRSLWCAVSAASALALLMRDTPPQAKSSSHLLTNPTERKRGP